MSDHQPSHLLALLGAGAAIVSVALFVGVTVNSGQSDTLPEALAAPMTTSTTATTSTSSTATTSTSSAPEYSSDEHGYVDSSARCDQNQELMAYGRTERSLVAICVDHDGSLQYRGVRLSDEASLRLPVTRGSDGTLIATNDGATYSISPKAFLVSNGDSVIYRDPWIEFKEPTFGTGTSASTTPTTSGTTAGSSTTVSSSATSDSSTTVVSTTTVTITSSATPTSKAGG